MSESDIPDEIVQEILSRMPVKALLRFKCVSKSFKDLIDSPQFIKQHLNHSKKSNSNLLILIRRSLPLLHFTDFESLNKPHLPTFQELNYPLNSFKFGTKIVSSCDGMLVLSNDKDHIFFWNPLNNSFHKLGVNGIEIPKYFHHFIVYGFGYDFVSDDYKLVRIVQFCVNGNNFGSEVKVYSLKSCSWRRIQDFPYYLSYHKAFGQLCNGALHWVVRKEVEVELELHCDNLIVAFDLGTEEYRLVPLPEFVGDEFLMNVGVLGGHLSVICNYHMNRVDIWVMNEYGVKESWSILFTLLEQCDVSTRDFESTVMLITYTKCGRKVLIGLGNGNLVWYDLVTKTTDSVLVRWLNTGYVSFDFHTCLQSLVLLDNVAPDFSSATIKDQKGKGKTESLKKK